MDNSEVKTKLLNADIEHIVKFLMDNVALGKIEEWVNSLPQKTKKEINIPFETFWTTYAYKKWDKLWCARKWNKLSDKERTEAMKWLELYLKQRNPDYIAMPLTWLNQKRWIALLEEEADKQKLIEVKKSVYQQADPRDWQFKKVQF